MEIPLVITAFSAEQLDRGGFTGLQDLSLRTADACTSTSRQAQ